MYRLILVEDLRSLGPFSKMELLQQSLAASILLVSLFLFFNPNLATKFWNESKGGESVAELTSSAKDVRWKSFSSFSWRDPEVNQSLSNGDYLFVGVGSEAKVSFFNGLSFVVGENSLIRVSSVAGEDTIDLSFGSFQAKFEKRKKIKIMVSGQVRDVSGEIGGEFLIAKPKNAVKSQIVSRKGKVTIAKSSSSESEKIVLTEFNGKRDLSSVALPDSKLSDDWDFYEVAEQSPESTEEQIGRKVKAQVQAQMDRWRKALRSEGIEVPAKKKARDKPKIIGLSKQYVHQESLSKSDELKSLKFTARWEEQQAKADYRFQVGNDRNFRKILLDKPVTGTMTSGEIKRIRGQEVFFRLLLEDKSKRKLASIEAPMNVKVDVLPFIEVPLLEFPEHESQYLSFDDKSNEPIVFLWKGVADARGYEIQISSKKDFQEIEHAREVKANNLILTTPLAPAKKYYWRVRTLMGERSSAWSLVNSVQKANY